MQSTLFHIPTRIAVGGGEVPLFGWGVLLAVWAVVALAIVARSALRHGLAAAVGGPGMSLAVLGGLILLLPRLDDGQGVPVRGFGVMLMAAATAGTWLAVRRGRSLGFDADTILGLGLWIVVAGLVGARLFFVAEYAGQFFRPGQPLLSSLREVLLIQNGGLVVFGALPTAAAAAWWYARRHGLPLLRLADCIAPALMLGLAIGRVGCFLNGCCYGGPTNLPWGVRFPPESPPWLDQAACGLLPPADASGPPWSLPVHPAQLYAAVDAALLAALAAAYTPVARRDGEVFAMVLTLHPLSRFLLEAIRVDERPALGTPLSISQLVSIVLLGLAGAAWWWLSRQPLRRPGGGAV
jgi:phosphatidylglycerol:prolipoprotein diacylglycerol transferase